MRSSSCPLGFAPNHQRTDCSIRSCSSQFYCWSCHPEGQSVRDARAGGLAAAERTCWSGSSAAASSKRRALGEPSLCKARAARVRICESARTIRHRREPGRHPRPRSDPALERPARVPRSSDQQVRSRAPPAHVDPQAAQRNRRAAANQRVGIFTQDPAELVESVFCGARLVSRTCSYLMLSEPRCSASSAAGAATDPGRRPGGLSDAIRTSSSGSSATASSRLRASSVSCLPSAQAA